MASHTVRAFEDELQSLRAKITEMGRLVQRQLSIAMSALKQHDLDLARRVVSADVHVDDLERDIEGKVVMIIARRQPMALDLREIVGAVRLASDLERIGDLAKGTARRTLEIGSHEHPDSLMGGVEEMGHLAMKQLYDVMDAYKDRDPVRAVTIWQGDAEINALYVSLLPRLLAYMSKNPDNVTLCTNLLFVAKNMERIGDHVTNVAETLYYLVSGKILLAEESEMAKKSERQGSEGGGVPSPLRGGSGS